MLSCFAGTAQTQHLPSVWHSAKLIGSTLSQHLRTTSRRSIQALARRGASPSRQPATLDAKQSLVLGAGMDPAGPSAPSAASAQMPQAPWYVRFTRWNQTSRAEGLASEQAVLGLSQLEGAGPCVEVRDVQIGPGKQDYLHTLQGGPDTQPPVVLMPGYGAGVGFFYRNLPSLVARFKTYAVDWLGTGLSGRPAYEAETREQSEGFFLDSLAAWREAVGMGQKQKMILVGHSLGGYLAARYALKHPEHVQHLVLVCPAGVPKQPDDWEHRFVGAGWRGQVFKFFMWGWEKGVTPGLVVRLLGPAGRKIVHGYVSNRFTHHGDGLSQAEVDIFKQYFYHIAALPGSGEYALRHLLAPGAWAYAPLEESLKELKVPVTFIYGRHDWMKPEHAVRVCEQLRKERDPQAPNDLDVEIIKDAGHFVFIDQPELFDKALTNVLLPYCKGEQSRAAAAYVGDAEVVHSYSRPTTSWGFAAGGLANGTAAAVGEGGGRRE